MKVVFDPVWLENPYHAELAKGLSSWGVQALCPESLRSFCRDHRAGLVNVEVLHLHSLPRFSWSPRIFVRYVLFCLRLNYLRRKGVRLVWTVHNLQNHETGHRWIENLLGSLFSRWVDQMIVHGNSAQQILVSFWGSRISKRIHVIPHGHYLHSYKNKVSRQEARAHFGLELANFIFVFLGQIRPYKGVLQMVKAFRACADPNARLIVAGVPINEDMAKEVALAIGGDPRIKFYPVRVADDDVQLYLNACDVFVLPYQRVLTSGAAILAMSFGKPCIAPRAGCVRDMLDEDGALFFDPSIDGDLDRAMRESISHRQKLPEMGRYNLQRASGWDWKSIARKTAAVYEQCLGTRRKPITHEELAVKMEQPTS